MKRASREPLVHFALLGAALFLVYGLLPRPRVGGDGPGQIVVTQGQIRNLVDGFTRAWQRPPTRDELSGLIEDRVREEVYCREAMTMGLDKDDTIIRRRLRQKIEFIAADIASLPEPSETELDAYLRAHADTFQVEPRFTFSHVFLDRGRRGEGLARDAAQLLGRLNQVEGSADASALGDPFLLERQFNDAPASEIVSQFGITFATKLAALRPGQWHGPIESGYGLHLVRVSRRSDVRLPALAEVRDAVRREWENARRHEANEAFYQELLKRHSVTIEPLGQPMLAVNLPKGEAK